MKTLKIDLTKLVPVKFISKSFLRNMHTHFRCTVFQHLILLLCLIISFEVSSQSQPIKDRYGIVIGYVEKTSSYGGVIYDENYNRVATYETGYGGNYIIYDLKGNRVNSNGLTTFGIGDQRATMNPPSADTYNPIIQKPLDMSSNYAHRNLKLQEERLKFEKQKYKDQQAAKKKYYEQHLDLEQKKNEYKKPKETKAENSEFIVGRYYLVKQSRKREIYKNASIYEEVVGEIGPGEAVKLLNISGNFGYISYGGLNNSYGYILLYYLKK